MGRVRVRFMFWVRFRDRVRLMVSNAKWSTLILVQRYHGAQVQ